VIWFEFEVVPAGNVVQRAFLGREGFRLASESRFPRSRRFQNGFRAFSSAPPGNLLLGSFKTDSIVATQGAFGGVVAGRQKGHDTRKPRRLYLKIVPDLANGV
jgi:hypothetical protein